MADRVIGGFNMSSNYEVSIKKPLDARSLVPSYEALTIKSNWVTSTNKPIAYNGMLVAVADTANVSKNGLYFLFDPNCTTSLKSPDVTVEEHWIKIGETSEIGDFVERLSKIDSELDEIRDRLTTLENEESDVITYGYRSGFPAEGEVNKLYIAADEGKSYVWFNNAYLVVSGAGEYETPDVICGGDSGI